MSIMIKIAPLIQNLIGQPFQMKINTINNQRNKLINRLKKENKFYSNFYQQI